VVQELAAVNTAKKQSAALVPSTDTEKK
jgi:hypothetical protein